MQTGANFPKYDNFLDADRQKGMDLLTGFAQFDITLESIDYEKRQDRAFESRKDSMQRMNKQGSSTSSNNASSQLNLGWLPGDLEGHLRSAAMAIDESIESGSNTSSSSSSSSTLSIQKALIDICRRTGLNNPWWVDESEQEMLLLESSSKSLQPITEESSGSNSGQLIGGLIALQKAPLASILAILSFLAVSII